MNTAFSRRYHWKTCTVHARGVWCSFALVESISFVGRRRLSSAACVISYDLYDRFNGLRCLSHCLILNCFILKMQYDIDITVADSRFQKRDGGLGVLDQTPQRSMGRNPGARGLSLPENGTLEAEPPESKNADNGRHSELRYASVTRVWFPRNSSIIRIVFEIEYSYQSHGCRR